MASRKAISVKIATVKVIAALENALAKLEKDFAAQTANEEKYQKALEKHNKEITKFALDNVKKATEVSVYDRWNGVQLSVGFPKDFEFPKTPVRDFVLIHDHEYRNDKAELENAIRILKMTDEELISTSTYNAISRFL